MKIYSRRFLWLPAILMSAMVLGAVGSRQYELSSILYDHSGSKTVGVVFEPLGSWASVDCQIVQIKNNGPNPAKVRVKYVGQPWGNEETLQPNDSTTACSVVEQIQGRATTGTTVLEWNW